MTPLANDRLIRALLREPLDRTPVWMMRQAGRYLPEYRATRARAGSFIKLMQTPELACEVTLQPLARFPLDAAILFSDILTIPAAMGLGLRFVEHEGPVFDRPVRDIAAIKKLPVPDPEADLGYVMDAIRLIRRELAGSVPLIGFAGSPWTLATYMVEGGSSRDFATIKTLLYADPAALDILLSRLAEAVTHYLTAQVHAGAQVLMLFDTWGGVLGAREYLEFSLRHMQHIVEHLPREHEGRRVPVILFTKGGSPWLEHISRSGCDGVGIDWTVSLGEARRRVGAQVALQGNLDHAVLRATPEVIRAQVDETLASFGPGSGHVFNLGHGITPDVPPEHAAALIQAVHELSPRYHR